MYFLCFHDSRRMYLCRWRPLFMLPWRYCPTGVTRVRSGSQKFSSSAHKTKNSTCRRMTWTFETRTSLEISPPLSTGKLKWEFMYFTTVALINNNWCKKLAYILYLFCVRSDHKRAPHVDVSIPLAGPAVFYHQECGTISRLQHLSDQNLEL